MEVKLSTTKRSCDLANESSCRWYTGSDYRPVFKAVSGYGARFRFQPPTLPRAGQTDTARPR